MIWNEIPSVDRFATQFFSLAKLEAIKAVEIKELQKKENTEIIYHAADWYLTPIPQQIDHNAITRIIFPSIRIYFHQALRPFFEAFWNVFGFSFSLDSGFCQASRIYHVQSR